MSDVPRWLRTVAQLMREDLPTVERLATDAQDGKIADPVFQQDFMIVYRSFAQCVQLFQDCHTEIWSTPTIKGKS